MLTSVFSFFSADVQKSCALIAFAIFFFLIQKEPPIAPNSETLSPFINPGIRLPCSSADVLQNCALIALRVMAEEGRDGGGFQVPELGEEWKMGCPKSPKWESEGEAWWEDESMSSTASHNASSTASREDNVRNDALHVMSFLAGLGAGKGSLELFCVDLAGLIPSILFQLRLRTFLQRVEFVFSMRTEGALNCFRVPA